MGKQPLLVLGGVGQRVDFQLVEYFTKLRFVRQTRGSASGLRRIRDVTDRVYGSDRELIGNFDRPFKIVHHNNAVNIGNWSADCNQSGTAENITMVELSGSITTFKTCCT